MTTTDSTKAMEDAPPLRKVDNMVAIASGKGGVGKTFVSATFAHSLARDGKRVLLFDGDLGLANIDVQLGLMPAHDLGSVVSGDVTLEQAVSTYPLGSTNANTGGQFDILAGKSSSGALSQMTTAELAGLVRGLTEISKLYDFVMIDLPAGIDQAVTLITSCCAINYIILTDEPTSLTDAYAHIKVAIRYDPHTNFRVIVNQSGGKREANRTFAALANACKNFLKVTPSYVGFVHRDSKVKDAIKSQTPILTRFPESKAAKDIALIAHLFANELS